MRFLKESTLKRKRPAEELGPDFTQKRVNALNELQNNIEKIKSNVKAVNEKRTKKRRKAENNLKEELEQLARQGGNPYEIVRERQERERVAKHVHKVKKQMTENMDKIHKRLQLEQMRENQREKKEESQKKHLKSFREEVGQRAKEEKVASYIRSRHVNGEEMIDPLGREAHIHPSKLMIVKDWKFGLGDTHSRNPQYMSKIQEQYPSEAHNPRAVPVIDDEEDSEESDTDNNFNMTSTLTKQKKKPVKNEDDESDEEYAQPEMEGLWDKKAATTSKAQSKKDSYQLRELSKLEKQYQAQALERARNNIIKKQVVWGKEFTGQPFIPSPAVALFEDFELEQKYQMKITLTNVSFTFNNFKLLELDNEIKDFFDIKYTFPGRMSAGTTCDIFITFTPRLLKDIESHIPFLAETGPFQVPLRCYTKKVVIRVEPNDLKVDFGSVILAEKLTKTITIRNSGALDTTFTLAGDAVEIHNILKTTTDMSQDNLLKSDTVANPSRVLKFSATQGYIGKHSTFSFQITFYPKVADNFESFVRLSFEDSFTEDITFQIFGIGQNVSIYLERETLDLKTCCLGTLYRDVLTIFNRGSISMKCELKTPKQLKAHLEFNPKVGFVQTEKPLQIQVKFKPQPSILKDAEEYVDSETGTLSIPIRVNVPDQSMPVFFDLNAVIVSSKLAIEPNMINFGKCSVDECISVPISIKNESLLPQKFGFINLPPEVQVTPNDGYATIYKHETLNCNIRFSPSAAIDYHFKLTCKTDRNESFIVSCAAVGIQSPLKFSTPLLRLASVAIGDRTSRTFTVTNISKKEEQSFTFLPPPESYISFVPDSGMISPLGSLEIQIKFEAPSQFRQIQREIPVEARESTPSDTKNLKKTRSQSIKNLKKKEDEKPTTQIIAEDKDNYEGWEASKSSEPWSRHRCWNIPCKISNYPLNCIYMQVYTTVVLSSLILEMKDTEVTEIDFGEIPVNHTVSQTLTIRNASNGRTKLAFLHPSKVFRSLRDNVADPNCPFKIIKPESDKLRIGETCEVQILYSPVISGTTDNYFAQFLSTTTNNASIRLKGSAKQARLRVEPPKSLSPPYLDLGEVCIYPNSKSTEERQSVQQFTIINESEDVTIPFDIVFPTELTHPYNNNSSNPFMAVPNHGSLQGKETIEVKVYFKPDHASNNYFKSVCHVNYGGMDQPEVLHFRCLALHPGVFIQFDDNPRPTIYVPSVNTKSRPSSASNKKNKKAINSNKTSIAPTPEPSNIQKEELFVATPTDEDDQLFAMENPFNILQKGVVGSSSVLKSVIFNCVNLKQRYEYVMSRVLVGQCHRVDFRVGNSKLETGKAEIECVIAGKYADQGFKFYEGNTTTVKYSLEPGATRNIGVQFEPKEPAAVKVLLKTKSLGASATDTTAVQQEDFWAHCDIKCTIKDIHMNETFTFQVYLRAHVFTAVVQPNE
jgi:hypothetical protein